MRPEGDFICQLVFVIYCAILGGAFTFEALRHFTRRGRK